ncbi:hypothetical protein P3T76_008082 [Phytophthora citrophthora]|uniref:Elicitin n=1 Tax=Phytophthora citrophthora TaxID=4793 RepID=A0AAD9GLI5_9STRA|nr:hypothetical protein P3T76_008082 [Phytophthora citrophthora]
MTSFSSFLFLVLTAISTITAEQCSTTELLTIAGSTHLDGCTSDVGFSGFSSISALSDKQIKAVCDNSDCLKLMDDMRAMALGDCVIPGTNISLESDILDPFKYACSSSGSVDLSSSSVGDGSVGSDASGSSSAICTSVLATGLFSFAVLALAF